MNRRQKKKKYKARHGYAKAEEAKVQCLIRETIQYAEDAIDQAEKRIHTPYICKFPQLDHTEKEEQSKMVEANKIIQRDRKGNWKVKGLEWEQLRAGETITREMEQALYAALWKLKTYEETGLSPNEIVAMMELVGIGIPQPVANHIAKDFK